MSSYTVTIRTHYQLTELQRERRPCNDYLNDRAHSTRKHASYIKLGEKVDEWGGRRRRSQTVFEQYGPSWLMPRVLATVTASIIWGVCGKMADMPEY